LAALVALPYWAQCRALARIYDGRYAVASLRVGNHLRRQAREQPDLRSYYVGEDGTFNDSPLFYHTAMTMAADHQITRVPPWEVTRTPVGQLVVLCGARTRRQWEKHFQTSVVLETDSCVTLRLDAAK
jgi:hypothetical protein